MTSSIAYNKEKDGTAIIRRIKAGVTVHIISINVPCVNDDGILFCLKLKCHNVRNNIHVTNIEITHKKNIKS